MTVTIPTTDPLAQHEREMLVGAFLDITGDQWAKWIIAQGGDENIPTELHEHLVAIATSLAAADDTVRAGGDDAANAYQPYLQALCMLSDSSLRWLVAGAGTDPLAVGDDASR